MEIAYDSTQHFGVVSWQDNLIYGGTNSTKQLPFSA